MVHQTTDEQMSRYRATAKQLAQVRLQRLQLKHQRAWEVARQAAEFLKEHYGAQQVAIFGSMLSCDRIDKLLNGKESYCESPHHSFGSPDSYRVS